MAEYISRDDVRSMILKYRADNPKKQTIWAMVISDMLRDLKEIPAADVQPVKQGRWIISNLYAQCSECSVAYDLDTFQRLIPMNENVPRHCTYCGSKNGLEGR